MSNKGCPTCVHYRTSGLSVDPLTKKMAAKGEECRAASNLLKISSGHLGVLETPDKEPKDLNSNLDCPYYVEWESEITGEPS